MGKDKALLQFEGNNLLDRAVDLCRTLCDEILISSDSAAHEINGLRRIADEQKDCGPMGGIYSCLKQSANEWNLVLSVDAPYVEPDFVRFLQKNTDEFEAVVPVHANKKEPLIALYKRNTLPVFEYLLDEGNYKMHFLLKKIKTNFVDADGWVDEYPKLFRNLNFPEDLSV